MSNQQILSDYFKVLFETENMIVGHVFETAYMVKKSTGKEINLGDFYGDPTCALISPDEDWCLVGGDKLVLWKQEKICSLNITDVFDMRQISKNIVEILTDPWSENSAVWQIDISTLKVDFGRKFDDYKEKEYQENIDWQIHISNYLLALGSADFQLLFILRNKKPKKL